MNWFVIGMYRIVQHVVTCVRQPDPNTSRLEGFQLNENYNAELVRPEVGSDYWRLYPDAEDMTYYYQTCSTKEFNKHFLVYVKFGDKK